MTAIPNTLAVAACADALIDTLGGRLVVGTPLGLGKANLLLNELYRRASADASIDLTILTALTLEPPRAGSDLEARFLGPLSERLFAGCPRLDYARARRDGALPDNIRVHEFFMTPGQYLSVASAQRDYISSNYTHICRDMVARGVNLLVQMVSPGGADQPGRFSLACNPDVTLDLAPAMRALGKPCAVVGEINDRLPFMYGDAVVAHDFFDYLCVPPDGGYALFGTPKSAVSDADFAIGLHASALVKDGGTLQVGIGSMGDAVIYALGLRHNDPARYRALLDDACHGDLDLCAALGGSGRFETGLYGASEMLVDGFAHLFDIGVLKRRVYDNLTIQRLLNDGRIGECPDADMLRALRDDGAIGTPLAARDIDFLRAAGVLRADVTLDGDTLCLGDGTRCAADIDDAHALAALAAGGLNERLTGASVAHGGFFLGPSAFYAWLNALPPERRKLLKMTSVARINQLYGGEELDKLQRRDARFINSCLMVTLGGAVVSDALEDGRVVSGVGGQYNFVAMAHELPGGRSIIKARATRSAGGKVLSNIVFNYGHTTIPRHLRDVVVSEYGAADLRGKSDQECYQAMLNIADSRFQDELLAQATRAGKIAAGYRIPSRFCNNLPATIEALLAPHRAAGLFGAFPFGTDLTADELTLGRALNGLKSATASKTGLAKSLLGALVGGGRPGAGELRLLERMQLATATTLRERLLRRLLTRALRG